MSFDYVLKLKWSLPLVDGTGAELTYVKGEFSLPEVSNLVFDDGDKFEVNVSYTEGDVHRS